MTKPKAKTARPTLIAAVSPQDAGLAQSWAAAVSGGKVVAVDLPAMIAALAEGQDGILIWAGPQLSIYRALQAGDQPGLARQNYARMADALAAQLPAKAGNLRWVETSALLRKTEAGLPKGIALSDTPPEMSDPTWLVAGLLAYGLPTPIAAEEPSDETLPALLALLGPASADTDQSDALRDENRLLREQVAILTGTLGQTAEAAPAMGRDGAEVALLRAQMTFLLQTLEENYDQMHQAHTARDVAIALKADMERSVEAKTNEIMLLQHQVNSLAAQLDRIASGQASESQSTMPTALQAIVPSEYEESVAALLAEVKAETEKRIRVEWELNAARFALRNLGGDGQRIPRRLAVPPRNPS